MTEEPTLGARRAKTVDLSQGLLACLKIRRGTLAISREQLVRRLRTTNKFTVAAMRHWENGRRGPHLEHFVAWADALGFDVELRDRAYESKGEKK
jgi:hypothetical protein